MFKQFAILGILAGIGASVLSIIYTSMYYSRIADFSEALGLVHLISTCFMFTMIACFVNVGLRAIIKNARIADFLFNMIFSVSMIVLVFLILKSNDPEFVNEDAQIMEDYYKGFLMPLLFFPALSWFTFTPLIIKK